MEKTKIKNFMDLDAWKEAHSLVLIIYKATKDFPKDEIYGLTNQLRRASVSITSNIAEGFSRQSFKEKIQFYSISCGSITEVQSQLLIARDLGFLTVGDFDLIFQKTITVQKLLNGLIRSIKNYNVA
ncbi:MAG: four helix bundle protein [Patescibacteria group bacterium]|nr:four helix bundle protein [Patescibacteria group bacterium]